MKHIDPSLGIPLPDKDYGGNCLIYDQTDNLHALTDDIIIPTLSNRYSLISIYFNFNYLKNKYIKYKQK